MRAPSGHARATFSVMVLDPDCGRCSAASPKNAKSWKLDELTKSNDPTHAFRGVVVAVTTGAALSATRTVRAAKGFSHSNAMKAAMRSQMIMAQKTLVQDPVFSKSQAAPGAAKSVANPFAV